MQRPGNENISPKVLHLVLRQLGGLSEEKLDGVRLIGNPEDPLDIQAIIEGPSHTPYEGGAYRVKICLGAEFPTQPPKAVFLTKIFHPNISPTGEVCVNTLKRDWDPASWNIGHIYSVIRCLLINPFPESALNEEAGRLFMESYSEYAAHAAMINRVHACTAATAAAADGEAAGAGGPGGSAGADGDDGDTARRKALKQAQKAKKTLKRL